MTSPVIVVPLCTAIIRFIGGDDRQTAQSVDLKAQLAADFQLIARPGWTPSPPLSNSPIGQSDRQILGVVLREPPFSPRSETPHGYLRCCMGRRQRS